MASAIAPNNQSTAPGLDISMTLPNETGLYVFGGGLLAFIIVIFIMRKINP